MDFIFMSSLIDWSWLTGRLEPGSAEEGLWSISDVCQGVGLGGGDSFGPHSSCPRECWKTVKAEVRAS